MNYKSITSCHAFKDSNISIQNDQICPRKTSMHSISCQLSKDIQKRLIMIIISNV